jgi:hypothetical protein
LEKTAFEQRLKEGEEIIQELTREKDEMQVKVETSNKEALKLERRIECMN